MTLPSLLLAAAVAASARDPGTIAGDPIAAILDAFRSHAVVAYGERHGDEIGHRFRLALIRDPRFLAIVDDLVVECGNARYQPTIDRFVRGDDVSYETLRQVWTAPYGVWGHPIYEEFFRTVRAVNAQAAAAAPRARQLRVLLGDPPIDWTRTQSEEQIKAWYARRDRYPADLIAREVIAKQRRAFVIYGAAHLRKQDLSRDTLVDLLERATGTTVFTIATHPDVSVEAMQVDVRSLRAPSVVLAKGTTLESQVNAVLYLGAASGRTQAHPSFQGSWKLDTHEEAEPPLPAPPPPPPPPGAPQAAPGLPLPPPPPPPPLTIAMTIEQTDTQLTIHRTLGSKSGVKQAVATAVYALDGTERVNQTGPVTVRTIVSWDGTRLVLTSTHTTDAMKLGDTKDVFTVAGNTLTIEHTRTTTRGTTTGKQVFVRSK